MAKFYTPTPTYSPKLAPQKNAAQEILEFKQQQKQQKREDEKYALEMQQAKMAYETGMLDLNAAKLKMEKVQKDQQLNQLAAQTYNTVKETGGSMVEALKAVDNVILSNGGWDAYQQHKKEAFTTLDRQLKLAELNPKAADSAAALMSHLGGGDAIITGDQIRQSIMQRKEKVFANGTMLTYDETGKPIFKDVSSPEMKARRKIEDDIQMEKLKSQRALTAQRAAARRKLLEKPAAKKEEIVDWKKGENYFYRTNPTTGELETKPLDEKFKKKPAPTKEDPKTLRLRNEAEQAASSSLSRLSRIKTATDKKTVFEEAGIDFNSSTAETDAMDALDILVEEAKRNISILEQYDPQSAADKRKQLGEDAQKIKDDISKTKPGSSLSTAQRILGAFTNRKPAGDQSSRDMLTGSGGIR